MTLAKAAMGLLFALGAVQPALAQPAAPVLPQDQGEMMKVMYLGAFNQLGVLEYCQAQGSVSPEVVALQQRMVDKLPASQVEGVQAAQAAGRRGVVQFGGSEVPLTEAAATKNTTAAAICRQIGDMLTSQAAPAPEVPR